MNRLDLSIDVWKSQLGLFPMPLYKDKDQSKKFILLNGGVMGNLCLDQSGDQDIQSARSFAWASDVGHYLVVDKHGNIKLYKWDSYKEQKYTVKSVSEKLTDFYDYLRKQEVNKQDSIVRFSLQIYRQIRTLLRDNEEKNSLNTLLYLFACIEAGDVDRNKLSLKKWNIGDHTKQFVDSIRDSDWSALHDMFSKGIRLRELKPDISLLLRHASGSIFQEAHFEALFPLNYQTTLPGFLPNIDKAASKKSPNQTSAHFTPTSVVRTIVEESLRAFDFVNKTEITVLDPACGSGEFLKEFIRQLKLAPYNYTGKINIIGWDISQTAIDMAKFIVHYEAQGDKKIKIDIETRDALEGGKDWKVKVDFVLMNPPFISWELMDKNQKEFSEIILKDLMGSRPNTAGVFLWSAVKCLNNNAVIGCVMPTSVFENESSLGLRNKIKAMIDVKIIGRMGSHTLFSNALVDTSLFIGKVQDLIIQNPYVFWSDFKAESTSSSLRDIRRIKSLDLDSIVDEKGYSIYINSTLIQKEDWMPIPKKSFDLIEKLKGHKQVKDIFDIRQGVRTGLNSAFIIPMSYYEKLNKKERKYFRPTVTNESIKNGQLQYKFFVFYAEGEYNILSKEELIKVVPQYYKDYIKPNLKDLIGRARKGEHNFWKLSEHRAWQINYAPRILSTEFGKAGDFAFDSTGEFVAERSHAWLPKDGTVFNDIGYAYISVLSMPIINDLLAGLSKQIGGGQWYLSSKYLNNMPLPDLFSDTFDKSLLQELISIGVQLSKGEEIDKNRLSQLSEIVYNA